MPFLQSSGCGTKQLEGFFLILVLLGYLIKILTSAMVLNLIKKLNERQLLSFLSYMNVHACTIALKSFLAIS